MGRFLEYHGNDSGLSICPHNHFQFPSIELIGVATAQGTWGGVTVVVAYFWGVVIFRETPKFFKWSLLDLAILILGAMLIDSCTVLGDKVGQKVSITEEDFMIGGVSVRQEKEKNMMKTNVY